MVIKKDFYFVRHGETDHNLLEGNDKDDHTGDIPLNQTGQSQAIAIEPIIAALPIKTVCFSPMVRAQQTKDLITPRLLIPHHEILALSECTAKIWSEMRKLGMNSLQPTSKEASSFFERVKKGLNEALKLEGPILIVAHGGVHWATCRLLGIQGHAWALENCGIVHFSVDDSGKWTARKISASTENC